MSKNDGGPAFPVLELDQRSGNVFAQHMGTSLRDWFAGQALQGMLAHATRYRSRPGTPLNWHKAIAEEAGEIADAMIEARGK